MTNLAWTAQSESLIRVQQDGSALEQHVRAVLGWGTGTVIYAPVFGYKLQVDAAYPHCTTPQTIVSVTYTQPDTPGHSNENKLHLKVGELALLKHAFPNIRVVLAIGGRGEAWLSYVLKVFQHFYDEVVFMWDVEGIKRLQEIGKEPDSVLRRNEPFWEAMRAEWNSIDVLPSAYIPPRSAVRYNVLDALKAQTPTVYNPSLIDNEIAQACMRESFNRSGTEWNSYLEGRWSTIDNSRSYFNPVEAVIDIILRENGLWYKGGIARDVDVPSLLHDFGMVRTKVSEDFVLHSKKLDLPVYIQSKASGGGRKQHGKNIQNRTKEQITRGILYRCRVENDHIVWKPKQFHWISVLDGNWGVSSRQPLKYVHMLQMAGYDMLFGAGDLVDEHLRVKRDGNILAKYLLDDLCCTLEAEITKSSPQRPTLQNSVSGQSQSVVQQSLDFAEVSSSDDTSEEE